MLLDVQFSYWREDVVHGGGRDKQEPVPIGKLGLQHNLNYRLESDPELHE